ncbi:MAG: hypothetical protein OEY74_09210 [Gammaproteobacteria bacterium]|nr:hypothetical protein [Gammaproteobacteria bacterium]
MNPYTRRTWIGGLVATLLAISAAAAPAVFNQQNRSYGNWAGAGLCYDISDGYICRDLYAWENYDVKGLYEFTEAAINIYRYRSDPSDGSWSNSWRYLSCPIDKQALAAHPNGVTLEVTLDPEGAGCYSFDYMETCDPINGCQIEPWPFPGPMAVSGEWGDPFSYGQSKMIQNGTNYDGWSGTTSKYMQQCEQRWGDAMQSGGFSMGIRSFEFTGPDGPVWSNYSLSSCNDHNMQQ